MTVLGASTAVANSSRTFSGPPQVTSAGQDEVSCTFAPNGSVSRAGVQSGPNLSISAAISGRAQPQAKLVLELVAPVSPAPLDTQVSFDSTLPQQAITFVARLSHDSESSFYEYAYAADTSVQPAVATSCLVQLTAFSEQHVTGQVACKDLSATSASLDAAMSAPTAKASGTIAFDCPVQVVDKNGEPIGGDGSGGSGSGGAPNAGGTGGSASGGTSAHGGTGGVGAAGHGGSGGTSTQPPSMGVGAPCSQSADCASPLSCHFDTEDYIADMQCTVPCTADSTCTNLFGSSSFCIGANVCVRKCSTDLDCAAKTHCNLSGWCERSGQGSGVPYCGGSATPCSLLSSSQCIAAEGCVDDSACTGIATGCYSLFDSYSCSSQQGCYWSTYSNSCSGSAFPCSLSAGSLSCAFQQGCFWTGGCTGVATSCSSEPVSLCTSQPGCTVETN